MKRLLLKIYFKFLVFLLNIYNLVCVFFNWIMHLGLKLANHSMKIKEKIDNK